MGIWGWSYPPGAENDPNAPYNQKDAPEPTDCHIEQAREEVGVLLGDEPYPNSEYLLALEKLNTTASWEAHNLMEDCNEPGSWSVVSQRMKDEIRAEIEDWVYNRACDLAMQDAENSYDEGPEYEPEFDDIPDLDDEPVRL